MRLLSEAHDTYRQAQALALGHVCSDRQQIALEKIVRMHWFLFAILSNTPIMTMVQVSLFLLQEKVRKISSLSICVVTGQVLFLCHCYQSRPKGVEFATVRSEHHLSAGRILNQTSTWCSAFVHENKSCIKHNVLALQCCSAQSHAGFLLSGGWLSWSWAHMHHPKIIMLW